jgi:hypothetical protein
MVLFWTDPPEEQISYHLRALFPLPLLPGERIEIRPLNPRTGHVEHRGFFANVEEAKAAALPLRESHHLYVGVATRRGCNGEDDPRACPRHKPGSLDHVCRSTALWTDLDVATAAQPDKPYRSVVEAVAVLEALPVRPSLIVHSGNGVHAYWTFAPPTPDRAAIWGFNRALALRLRGDPGATGAAHCMRLAGTLNHKDLDHPSLVSIVKSLVRWPA